MIYHPRKDIYHCCFRLLSILSLTENESIDIDKLRIIDFFLVFPNYLVIKDGLSFNKYITFPKGKSISAKILKKIDKPFEYLLNPKILFSELSDFQTHALLILKAKKIIEIDNELVIKSEKFNTVKDNLISDTRFVSDEVFKELIMKLLDIDNLKTRTKLMESRYDSTI